MTLIVSGLYFVAVAIMLVLWISGPLREEIPSSALLAVLFVQSGVAGFIIGEGIGTLGTTRVTRIDR